MNILLLGNGYDLHYKLPTSYRNFLLTIDFLLKSDINSLNFLGDVFGNQQLNEQDPFIKASYNTYHDIYNKIPLDKTDIKSVISQSKNNIWINYFISCFNKDVGWIDFEKEIAYVISCFQIFFLNQDITIRIEQLSNEVKFMIINNFNFFIDLKNGLHKVNGELYGPVSIKEEYILEYPLNSRHYIINTNAIIDYIYLQLYELSNILKNYLRIFVDNLVIELVQQSLISELDFLKYSDILITFNYTNTFELLEPGIEALHIHGNVNNEIVLGVNSDLNDELDNIDTLFIKFKKYYQRTFYDTDMTYLRWLRSFTKKENKQSIHLLIMGHSLDETDKEVIENLFSLSDKIAIIYHDKSAKSQYIQNLIKIFGKHSFDQLRNKKKLEFLPINFKSADFLQKQANNSTLKYQKELDNFL